MSRRSFLFLQGPPGPLFRQLGAAMAARGVAVHRINLSGGDRYDWPSGRDSLAVDYRGTLSDWPAFLDRILRRERITDIMLFGDCRPWHRVALGVARLRGVAPHVLEEGYLRPDWMTLEPEGVNAHSRLPRDIDWFREEAANLPPEEALPPITASFSRRARDSYWHYHHVVTGRFAFPHYRTHRNGSIVGEGLGWAWKWLGRGARQRRSAAAVASIAGKPYFLFPLQLSGDFQIRTHSPFPDMNAACRYVLESFAHHAPADVHLFVKPHPLDCRFDSWEGFVRRLARDLGISDRVAVGEDGDLDKLSAASLGMVVVNSTSGTLALMHDRPVMTLGDAIYDLPGLTHQGSLDDYWDHPTPPEPGAYAAFRRVLVDRSLVRGGLASQSATETLIEGLLDRLGLVPRD